MKHFLVILFLFLLACTPNPAVEKSRSDSDKNYEELKDKLLTGWNTWDNRSVMTWVKLPEERAVILELEDGKSGEILEWAFTGNRVPGSEKVTTIAHTTDGSYTDLILDWRNISVRIQSVSEGEHLYIRLCDLIPGNGNADKVYIREEFIYKEDPEEKIIHPDDQSSFFLNQNIAGNINKSKNLSLEDTLYAYSGHFIPEKDVDEKMDKALDSWNQKKELYGEYSESYNAIQNAINWTVVYDPVNKRPVVPVSRPWSFGWGNGKSGGWVQFCWDNFFVSYMHAIESRDLAFNEAIQMCNYIDEMGFVPNYAGPGGIASRDRSQPPVGSMMIREIYKMHPEKWFLEKTYDQLLTWNRWWSNNRDREGYLCWGSNPFDSESGNKRELTQNVFEAASNESGLDNTPMYDGVKFDTIVHMLDIADVGLMSLYIADCDALAEIAGVLGKPESEELKGRADKYRKNLRKLWDDDFGLFLNKHLPEGELSYRISPVNFYPLLAKAATQKQAERMINEHFYNPEEFWGKWIIPSAARNDTAYTGQDYWRGSIWAPMNFLVYLGIRNYDLPDAGKDLSEKSHSLLMKEWMERAYVRENYHAETGGAPAKRSEHFYHWGALLGMINMIEEGYVPPPEEKLK